MRRLSIIVISIAAIGAITAFIVLVGGRSGEAASGCADVDGDGVLHFMDAAMVSQYFFLEPANPPQVDIDKSGSIRVSDIIAPLASLDGTTSCQGSPLSKTVITDGDLAVDADGESTAQSDSVETTRIVPTGETFHVTLHVTSNPGAIVGYQARVHWDESILDLVQRDAGQNDLLAENAAADFSSTTNRQVLGPADDNSGNDAFIELGALGLFAPNATAYTGPVAQLEFVCQTNGTAQITLEDTTHTALMNRPATEYDPAVANAAIACTAATPTATTANTETPASPATITPTPNPAADDDGDGIANSVDTIPDQFSENYSDVYLGGNTYGTIFHAPGMTLQVHDEPFPDGVRIAGSGTGGPAPVVAFCSPEMHTSISPGDDIVITCDQLADTPTVTLTPTNIAPPTITHTPTNTVPPTVTNTPTITNTPTPTLTPTWTPTWTPTQTPPGPPPTLTPTRPGPPPTRTQAPTATPGSPDLVVTKSASAGTVVYGAAVTYTIEVRNVGTAVATNVVVLDQPHFTFGITGFSTTRGSCIINGGGLVECHLNNLDTGPGAGARATVTVTERVFGSVLTSVQNTATVDPFNIIPESNEGNNIAMATVFVAPF